MIQFSLITKDNGTLTKNYELRNGELVKDSSKCFLSTGRIEIKEMEFKDFPAFLDNIQENQAIIHGIPDKSQSKIVAKRYIEKYPDAITRSKENFSWPECGVIMLDYDPLDGVAPLSKHELLAALRKLDLSLAKAAMVWRPSASSNLVGLNGEVYRGLRNQRVYIEYKNPENINLFVKHLEYSAWDNNLGYIFVTAAGTALPRCIFDTAVFSPERLDFAAGAVCGNGLREQQIISTFSSGEIVDFDSALIKLDSNRYNLQVEEAKRAVITTITAARAAYIEAQSEELAGIKKISKAKAARIVSFRLKNKLLPEDILYNDNMEPIMVSDVILNPEVYNGMVIRDPLEPKYGKSKAKIFVDIDKIIVNSFAHGGRIFELKLNRECYQALLEKTGDITELLDNWTDNIGSFVGSVADREQIAKYVSDRTKISKSTLVKDLSRNETRIKAEQLQEIEDLTHHQIAERLLAQLPKNSVGAEGKIYNYNGKNCWEAIGLNEIELKIANNFDCLPKCSRRMDYVHISKHLYTMVEDTAFFIDTSPVIATKNSCWLLKSNGDIAKVPHDPKYRVRFLLPFASSESKEMPFFNDFLSWAFGSSDGDQAMLVQEIAGAILFGVLTQQWHKAVLFRGDGSNGKSVLADIFCQLIPAAYITHISPFQFNEPIYLAQLSHKLLNVATELEQGQKLPGAAFKQVVDSSVLLGKSLYQQPFEFPSTAAHLFSSNYPLYTTDGSTGMRRRWLMVWFGNTVKAKDRVPQYGKYISQREAPQIFNWALAGARRLYQNKDFTYTKMGKKLATEMFVDTDPLSSFLSDRDVVGIADPVTGRSNGVKSLRSNFYNVYKQWCEQTNQPKRRILTKTSLNQIMLDKGFDLTKSGGKVYWAGVRLNIS